MLEKYPLTELVDYGRSLTADIKPRPLSGLSGWSEFWQCVQNTPASQIQTCVPHLTGKDGIEVDITKPPKIPVEVKPNWLWLALGFMAGWILKR